MKLLPGRRVRLVLLTVAAVAAYLGQRRRSPARPTPQTVYPPAAAPPRPARREEPTMPVLGLVAQPAPAPVAAKPSPRPRATPAPASASEGAYGPGSAPPMADGSAPSPEYTIKGNASSMLFHTPSSPYYGRTIAEVWFRTEEDARRAGFTGWVRRGKVNRSS